MWKDDSKNTDKTGLSKKCPSIRDIVQKPMVLDNNIQEVTE